MSRKTTLADRIMKMRQDNPSSISTSSTKPPSRSSLDTTSRRLTSASTTTMNGRRENSAETEQSVINILKERRIRSNKILLDIDPEQLKDVQPVSERISDWQIRNRCTKKDGDHLSVPSDETRSNISSQTPTNTKKRKESLRSNTTQYSVRARVVYDDSSSPSKRRKQSTLTRPLADIIKDSESYKNLENCTLQHNKENTTENEMKPSFDIAEQTTGLTDGEPNAKKEVCDHSNEVNHQFDTNTKLNENESNIQTTSSINNDKNRQEKSDINTSRDDLLQNDEKKINVKSDSDKDIESQTVGIKSSNDNTEAKDTNEVVLLSTENQPIESSTDNRQSSEEVKHVTKVTVVSKQKSEDVFQNQNSQRNKKLDLNTKSDAEEINSMEMTKDHLPDKQNLQSENSTKSKEAMNTDIKETSDDTFRQDISMEIKTSEDNEIPPGSLNDESSEGKQLEASNLYYIENQRKLDSQNSSEKDENRVNVDQKVLSTETTVCENHTEKCEQITLPKNILNKTKINHADQETFNQFHDHEIPIAVNSTVAQQSPSKNGSASTNDDKSNIENHKLEMVDATNTTKQKRVDKSIDQKHISNHRESVPTQIQEAEHISPNQIEIEDCKRNEMQKRSAEREENDSENENEQNKPEQCNTNKKSTPSADDNTESNKIKNEQIDRNSSIGNKLIDESVENEIDSTNNSKNGVKIDQTKDPKIEQSDDEKVVESSEVPKRINTEKVKTVKELEIEQTTTGANPDDEMDKTKNGANDIVIAATDATYLNEPGKTQKGDDINQLSCNKFGDMKQNTSPVVAESTAKCQDVNLEKREHPVANIDKDTETKLDEKKVATSGTQDVNSYANSSMKTNVERANGNENPKGMVRRMSSVSQKKKPKDSSNPDKRFRYLVQTYIRQVQEEQAAGEGIVGAIGKWKKSKVLKKNKERKERLADSVGSSKENFELESNLSNSTSMISIKSKYSQKVEHVHDEKDSSHTEQQDCQSTENSDCVGHDNSKSDVADSMIQQSEADAIASKNERMQNNHQNQMPNECRDYDDSNDRSLEQNEDRDYDDSNDRSLEQNEDHCKSQRKYETAAIVENSSDENTSENLLVNYTGKDSPESGTNKDTKQSLQLKDDKQLDITKHSTSGTSQIRNKILAEDDSVGGNTQTEINLSKSQQCLTVEAQTEISESTNNEEKYTETRNEQCLTVKAKNEISEVTNDEEKYTETPNERCLTVKAKNDISEVPNDEQKQTETTNEQLTTQETGNSEKDSNKSLKNCENIISNNLEINKISTSNALNEHNEITDEKQSNENCQDTGTVDKGTSEALLSEQENNIVTGPKSDYDTSLDTSITHNPDCPKDFNNENKKSTNTSNAAIAAINNRGVSPKEDNCERYQTQYKDDTFVSRKIEKLKEPRDNTNECAPVLLSKPPPRIRNKLKTARKSINRVPLNGDLDNCSFEDSQAAELPRLSRLKRQYTNLNYAPSRENSFYGIDNQDDYKFGDGTLLFQENEKIKHTSRVEEILMELYFAQKPDFKVQNGDRLTYQYFNTNMGFSRSSTKILKSSKEFLFDRQNTFDYKFAESLKRFDIGKQRETSFFLPSPRGQCRKLKAYARLQKKLSHVLKQ